MWVNIIKDEDIFVNVDYLNVVIEVKLGKLNMLVKSQQSIWFS